MPIKHLLYGLILLPIVVIADAGDGQFMGYELGTSYPSAPKDSEVTTTGNLLIVAENPVKPGNINEVRLVTTPGTRTIGYIAGMSWYDTESEAREVARRYVELLRAKYPDWEFGREMMDARMKIVGVNFDMPPHNIQLRLDRDGDAPGKEWRFSMGLGWITDSKELRAWQEKASSERRSLRTLEQQKLMDESDMSGL
jgi:hypothetical protein